MKMPYLALYTGDWLKDPCLTLCSPATRGIWIDAICAMHELRVGTLTGTPDQLARVLRCSSPDLHAAFGELKTTKAADVRECNGLVTLICRRMVHEAKARQQTVERVHQHRETQMKRKCNAPCNAVVTPLFKSVSSTAHSALALESAKDLPPPAKAGTPKGVNRPTRFVAPSLTEVAGYMRERCWADAERMAQKFVDHYATCGWVQGKAKKPIKDWKAAVRTWENEGDGVKFEARESDAPVLGASYAGACCVCGRPGRGMVVDGRKLEPFCRECEQGVNQATGVA
jgi:hypothetical protein